MKDGEINIYIDYHDYSELYNQKSKQVVVNCNLENIAFYESFIDSFIENKKYFDILKAALSTRNNINIILIQGNEVLLKNTYSPISIVLGIKHKEEILKSEFKREFKVLLNKIIIDNYLNRNIKKTYSISIDGKNIEYSYDKILAPILNSETYYEFNNSMKYLNLSKNEYVYLLKEFMIAKRIFFGFELTNQTITFYKSLIQTYDTLAINKYLVTNFKYSLDVKISEKLANILTSEIPKNMPLIEKTIYIYLNMFNTFKYDYELVDDKIIKKHKDLNRIQEIDAKNNKVFSYEFSCLLAKMLERLNINFEYNDKYIIARINKFIIKFKAITNEFNAEIVSQLDILKGITIINENKNTKTEFNKIMNKIYNNIYQKRINMEILKMPFNKLLVYYKSNTNTISINFDKKYDIFIKLISNVHLNSNAIGYIYELKKIIFNESELNSNISFATIAEIDAKKINPVVIITINSTNINLYNSNKYIYYNPPQDLEFYNLNDLRMNFFKGRFKYIKGNKDNIIGVEKGN